MSISPVFIFPAHSGCIKALAIGGRFLASGSSDEIIKLYDLKKLREIGHLTQQDGTITALEFHESSHLVSASEDGTLCIFRSKDWELLKTLKGHKERANSIAIHPSGKLALSTGKDKTLRMWDLVSGHQAFKSKLQNECEKLIWSQNGENYLLIYSNSINLFDHSGEELITLASKTKILCAKFLDANWIAFSGEDKLMHFIHISSQNHVIIETGHTFRIREISVFSNIIVSCSSDGLIKCWDWKADSSKIDLQLIASHNLEVRLTCLATAPFTEI